MRLDERAAASRPRRDARGARRHRLWGALNPFLSPDPRTERKRPLDLLRHGDVRRVERLASSHGRARRPVARGCRTPAAVPAWRSRRPAAPHRGSRRSLDPHSPFDEGALFFGKMQAAEQISRHDLATRAVSVVAARRPMRFVDLTGHTSRGSEWTRTSSPRRSTRSRRPGRRRSSHPDVPDGLLFHSRHDLSVHVVALFDRVEGEVEAQFRVPSLVEPGLRRSSGRSSTVTTSP
jgi:hypothetical protein